MTLTIAVWFWGGCAPRHGGAELGAGSAWVGRPLSIFPKFQPGDKVLFRAKIYGWLAVALFLGWFMVALAVMMEEDSSGLPAAGQISKTVPAGHFIGESDE
jgi:hypothetical protein